MIFWDRDRRGKSFRHFWQFRGLSLTHPRAIQIGLLREFMESNLETWEKCLSWWSMCSKLTSNLLLHIKKNTRLIRYISTIQESSSFDLPADLFRDNALAPQGILEQKVGGPKCEAVPTRWSWMSLEIFFFASCILIDQDSAASLA